MDCQRKAAFRAKEVAEKKFAKKDLVGARKYAIKAHALYPELDGISQMLATFEVYAASMVPINGEVDFYAVLGLNQFADEEMIKKQYKKLALILHPDKNKTVGADGAFKLVSEAWSLLSDREKKIAYDVGRKKQSSAEVGQANHHRVVQTTAVNGFSNNCSKRSNAHSNQNNKLPTFWTICTSCKVQYEYLRKYLNNRLSCKNCHKTFMAIETGGAPVNGSIPFCSWSFSPHANQVTYIPADTIFFTGGGVPGYHSGFNAEYTVQWSTTYPSASSTPTSVQESTSAPAGVVRQVNGKQKRTGKKLKAVARDKDNLKVISNVGSETYCSPADAAVTRVGRPEKKMKVEGRDVPGNGNGVLIPNTIVPEARLINGHGNNGASARPSSASEPPVRRLSIAPAFDARQLLIDKARADIRKKLEEMRLAAAIRTREKEKSESKVGKSAEPSTGAPKKKPGSVSITVPDSDFHDFDHDRSEDCFKPKQLWALYDEEDGMPRLYCLVRQVLSVKPFKIEIKYLNSKTDPELESTSWEDFGFHKPCGYYRAGNPDIIESVNIFSHVMRGGKIGRGGSIQIFPKKGDIWTLYRNWSPDWDRKTSKEVRHQYDMVEVVDDYSEKLGVCVTPLLKAEGFKTVYQRMPGQNLIRWIPRKEMLRFSHLVPSWLLNGGEACNLPEGCWDLDPAAMPEELLQSEAAKPAGDSEPVQPEEK
ncbi:hypothetical protein Syun_009603 [Stephania yunnanensis]|uniref:J domain-containing protein n=1 Tax=Stephania yunnanensis TaxID=152371 RepID=A0AAP0KGQ3_9MAGN